MTVHRIRYLGTLALVAAFVALPAQGSLIWNEINAGPLPTTAEVTFGSGALTQINGHLDFDLDTQLWGVDLYAISIVHPTQFSARTEAGAAKMDDPALYLFNASGRGVYMNNDTTAANFQATLPTGSAFGPVTAGLYYLAIAWGFSDALSFDSIFDLNQFVNTTGVYGPSGPGGGSALAGWNPAGPANFDVPAAYTIDFTGAAAAVPEPGTLALLVAAIVGIRTRRRTG